MAPASRAGHSQGMAGGVGETHQLGQVRGGEMGASFGAVFVFFKKAGFGLQFQCVIFSRR